MKDRFDLEHDIMETWSIKEHLNLLGWRMMDHPEEMTQEDIWNHIWAIENSLDLRCMKLMDTFCQVFELNDYASDEVKEMRAMMLSELTKKADKEDKIVFPAPKKGKKK